MGQAWGGRHAVDSATSSDSDEGVSSGAPPSSGDEDASRPAPAQSAHQVPRRRTPHFKKVRRILERDTNWHQCTGRMNIIHRNETWSFVFSDTYHVLIHVPLRRLLLLFVLVYVCTFLFFAALWYIIDEPCGIELGSYTSAFYLSVETQMTIGYGVPDPNFNNCPEGIFVLLAQSLGGLFLDAVMLGVVFSHVSRAYTRASTVVFSDKAVMQVIDGTAHLIFRVAEMQRHPLLQAVMQVYCVQHHYDENVPGGIRVEVQAVQLQEPDTDLYNGVIFLGLPAMVVHKVAYGSPLAPPLPADANPDDAPPPQAVWEHVSTRPYLEVLVLLSGTEDATASSIEARHSYTLDDIVFEESFRPCVSIDSKGVHCIDFLAFHDTEPLDDTLEPTLSGLHYRNPRIHSRRCLPATVERSLSDASVALE